MDLSLLFLCVISVLVIIVTHWIYRWRNPKCNGKLPPGSMGFPLIGESIQFLIPSKSVDITPFIKKRMKKYGPLFRTNLAGQPVVVTLDPDFSCYLLQQEGKLVEIWYMDSFAKLVRLDVTANIHKYFRNLILSKFGLQALKEQVLPQLEDTINRKLDNWSKLPEVEVKKSTAAMIFEFTVLMMFSYKLKKSEENIVESLSAILGGIISFPLNIPGTAYHRCVKTRKRVMKLLTDLLNERMNNPEIHKGDCLDQIMKDMKKEEFLDAELSVDIMFAVLLVTFETISATLTLAILFLTQNPSVLKELTEEHEAILNSRENTNSGLTWEEYKSMTFTHYVINETLRLGSVVPGILRRAIQDIHVDGYTIPKGWTIFVVPAALQMNPNTYEDPLTFKPSRWKNAEANTTAKNFIPFGGGLRSCAGAEFSKFIMGVFLHVLVTKYRWTKVKGGEVTRSPVLGFGKGFYIKLSAKHG